MSDLEELQKRIRKFTEDRDWKQFHNPKDLAISLSIEASELLEVYQWSGVDLEVNDKLDKVKEELADVLIYGLQLADAYNLDVKQIINDKIDRNAKKYPADKAYGKKDKYTEL